MKKLMKILLVLKLMSSKLMQMKIENGQSQSNPETSLLGSFLSENNTILKVLENGDSDDTNFMISQFDYYFN